MQLDQEYSEFRSSKAVLAHTTARFELAIYAEEDQFSNRTPEATQRCKELPRARLSPERVIERACAA